MIVIALGGNLTSPVGPPDATIAAALEELRRSGVAPVAISPFYETEAWPDPGDPPFVNAVARVETALDPASLIAGLQRVERAFGRVRSIPNAPRTLDLDILDYEGLVLTGEPTLPHPRMETRGFVLVPLADVAPDWVHPVSGRTVGELIAALPDRGRAVRKMSAP
jgi:2-amino-4-hydroxy-6-hydroxymethyldihydropteridine diphosphokinase